MQALHWGLPWLYVRRTCILLYFFLIFKLFFSLNYAFSFLFNLGVVYSDCPENFWKLEAAIIIVRNFQLNYLTPEPAGRLKRKPSLLIIFWCASKVANIWHLWPWISSICLWYCWTVFQRVFSSLYTHPHPHLLYGYIASWDGRQDPDSALTEVFSSLVLRIEASALLKVLHMSLCAPLQRGISKLLYGRCCGLDRQ